MPKPWEYVAAGVLAVAFFAWQIEKNFGSDEAEASDSGAGAIDVERDAYSSCRQSLQAEALYSFRAAYGGGANLNDIQREWTQERIHDFSYDEATQTGSIHVSGRYHLLSGNAGYLQGKCTFKTEPSILNPDRLMTHVDQPDSWRGPPESEGRAVPSGW